MSAEEIRNSILNCETKDETGLNDFQKLPDDSGIAIDKVGINNYRIPLQFRHQDGTVMNHDATVSMYVNCQSGKTGINMSRLGEILLQESAKAPVDGNFFKKVLHRFRADMRDSVEEDFFDGAYLKIRYAYSVKQPSLKSNRWGWQYYDCILEGHECSQNKTRLYLTVDYKYSSTCPCSLSMSKQYEKDFAAGKEWEGNGIAVGHSQRSLARVTMQYSPDQDFSVEELVAIIRKGLPTETQSMVKRLDEQAFAIMNGSNPMFVEHATRRLSRVLNADKRILDWAGAVEHWESLHSHNAVGVIRKGIPGGLR